MTNINKKQIAAIHTLISKLNLPKADIVIGASSGRTESVGGLTSAEANDLIKYLKSQDPEEKKAEKVRRVIISMAHELGYRKPGTKKVDMAKLDEWCMKYGKFKKKLNQHSLSEVNELRWQFGQYHGKFIRDY